MYVRFVKYSRPALLLVLMILLGSCSSSVRYNSGSEGGSAKTPASPKKESSKKKNKIKVGKISGCDTLGSDEEDLDDEYAEGSNAGEGEELQLRGIASYYADKFDGRLTANGEEFDNTRMTAAHRTLPFGAMVLVRNLKNNKTVTVIINDRGPYVEGRIIDLSKAAAEQLDMIRSGVAEVELEIIQ